MPRRGRPCTRVLGQRRRTSLACWAVERGAVAYFRRKTLRAKGFGGSLDLTRFLLQSPRQWLTETFENPYVQAMLGAWGIHLDFAPDVARGAMFPYLEGMAGQAFGMLIRQSGADTMVKALVAAIRARGGVVETNTPVARILQEGGKATGIQLSDGRKITVIKGVIAGVAPKAMLTLTGGATPAYDTAMSRFAHAPGTMMIHSALSNLPEWTVKPLKSFAYAPITPGF